MVVPAEGQDAGAERPRSGDARPVKSAAAFRTISEVANELDVAQHVLRFWESKFPQVRPLKRGGGRRYYRPEDIDLLRQIRSLLYEQGYTIKGAQKLLKGQRRAVAGDGADNGAVSDTTRKAAAPEASADAAIQLELDATERTPTLKRRLTELRDELVALRQALRNVVS